VILAFLNVSLRIVVCTVLRCCCCCCLWLLSLLLWWCVVHVVAADGREDAIELLKQLFMKQVHGLGIDLDLRGHILVRLKRLCAIPGDGRLSFAAKQAFKEAFLVREEQHSVLCFGGGGRATGQSVAGWYYVFVSSSGPMGHGPMQPLPLMVGATGASQFRYQGCTHTTLCVIPLVPPRLSSSPF
jgi:hypothetical protein